MNFKFGDEPSELDFSVGGDNGEASNAARPAATPSASEGMQQPPRIPRGPLPPAPMARRAPSAPAPTARPAREFYEEEEAPVRASAPRYEEDEYQEAPRRAAAPRFEEDEYGQERPARRPAPRYEEEEYEDERPVRRRTAPAAQSLDAVVAASKVHPRDRYDEVEEAFEDDAPTTRRAPRAAKAVAEKPVKTKKPAKKKGPGDWAGGRRKVLITRIAFFTVVGLLILAGLNSFLPKASTLTEADRGEVLSNVRMELGITEFPATTGEAVALGFSEAFLGYGVNSREAREAQLLRYVPTNVLKSFDVRFASEADLVAANTVTPVPTEGEGDGEGDDLEPDVQEVTGGPYVIGRKMVAGGQNAVYTTATEVNNRTWLYMEVPLYFDEATNSVSVSGSPSFTDGPKAGAVPENLFATDFAEDTEVEAAIEEDIPNFFRAWGASDTSNIERFVLKQNGQIAATENAVRGLNNAVKFVRVDDVVVESKNRPAEGASEAELAEFREREARVTVTWLEPTSGLVYSQVYAMKLAYSNEDWFIKDVENQGITLGQSRERL